MSVKKATLAQPDLSEVRATLAALDRAARRASAVVQGFLAQPGPPARKAPKGRKADKVSKALLDKPAPKAKRAPRARKV